MRPLKLMWRALPEVLMVMGAFLLVACGDGGTGPNDEPERVDVRWVSIATSKGVYSDFSCALTDAGIAYCWGSNGGGSLGIGSHEPQESNEPVPVAGNIRFHQIAAGNQHTCGLSTDGGAFCWGSTAGFSGGSYTATPTAIPGGITFAALHSGFAGTCGVTEEGTVYCWVGHESQPEKLPGDVPFKSLTHSGGSWCGLSRDGDLYCWRAINADHREWTEPVRLSDGYELETLDEQSPCGLDSGGSIHCWTETGTYFSYEQGGLAFKAKSGVGGLTNSGAAYHWYHGSWDAPTPMAGGIVFGTLSLGFGHTCGTTPEGKAYCWGCNSNGQLGDGSKPPWASQDPCSDVPVLVIDPRKWADHASHRFTVPIVVIQPTFSG